ncbi:DMT family transporter [Streptomyces decoyicus]|uniref:DMT family transporter n=1 Tax=Streptomyces decoyicus TaxID=249567 RepID=UPI0004AA7FF1|nr:DMT family transporter [Streptomyces decoyicus]KOG50513.1 membrane protein [Streptomyces decoyicus]QZY15090.1 DMT family transporter [Streptomyces decoyicus]
MTVILLALGAACCLGLGFVFQQAAAQRAPMKDFLSVRLLLDLVRMPLWLAGIGLMVVGMALGAVALGMGDITLVEPLLATNLLFAMALSRRLTRQRLGRSGWAGLWLLAGGVTAFIVAGRPQGGERSPDHLWQWLIMGMVLGTALLLAAVAKRERVHVSLEAALLGIAAGLIYGLQDALTRISGEHFGEGGWSALLTSWQPYAIVVLGVLALVFVQSAFESAPLRLSLPALTAAQPLAGIACGVGFLGDQLQVTAGALAWEVIGIIAVVAGIVLIGSHPAMPPGSGRTQNVRELQPH